MKIGYFGIPGSFTHTVATREFPDAELVGALSFRSTFENLANDSVDEIVVPIENTLAGSIYENYDLLDKYDFAIRREMYLKIGHMLLGVSANISSISEVHSHQKALEQCSDFLHANPHIKPVIASDTASAARLVAEKNDPSVAAIASKENAAIYGLTIVRSNIENDDGNYTRFLGIAKNEAESTRGYNKSSLIVTLPHVQGSLFRIFELFNETSCNVTKIESRPLHSKPFEYTFYLDFTFDKSLDIDMLLAKLATQTLSLKQVGTYEAVHPW